MNLKELQESNKIIYETISGSHAYNLSTPNSDIDIRGVYINPNSEYLKLYEPSKQINDEKNDITYYSLKRFFELVLTANPNIIELLWMPEECIKIITPKMKEIIKHRDLFISKKCFHTHSGYAFAQIKKAKGQNKKVHNPQPEKRPEKEDFCYIITNLAGNNKHFPSRPIPLKLTNFNLTQYHVASLEHSNNIYRLYYYGNKSKGVFRGDDMLVCESIPKEDEFNHFCGLLIYNQEEYNKSIKDWHSYWDWVKNRNDKRWIDQEKGLLNYDQKNMMHCMRLLISGENILKEGFPIVKFTGKDRDYLIKIRAGEMKYEDIMNEINQKMLKLEELYNTSNIPHSVNVPKINELYEEITKN